MFILKQLRREKNISQTDLAKVIGVSLRTIQLYEKRDANIPHKNLTKIAQYFDMDIGQLYSKEVNEINAMYSEDSMVSKKGHSIIKMAPGKYLLSVPLVTRKEEKEYVLNHGSQKFLGRLIQINFMVQQVSQARYAAFEISNDSMDNGETNGMPQGTIVLGKEVSKTEFKKRIKKGKDLRWIIVYKDAIMCKEITAYDSRTKKLTCHSLNGSPEYPDFEIELNEVKQFFVLLKKQIDEAC